MFTVEASQAYTLPNLQKRNLRVLSLASLGLGKRSLAPYGKFEKSLLPFCDTKANPS